MKKQQKQQDKASPIEPVVMWSTVEKVVIEQVVNQEAVIAQVLRYLAGNKIADYKYKLDNICFRDYPHKIEISLTRLDDDYGIDEDFDSDESWEKFLNKLAEDANCRRVGVPYYYYSK